MFKTAVVGVLVAGLVPILGAELPASAAGEIEISGSVVASEDIGVGDVQLAFCAPATPYTCVNPSLDASGAFTTTLLPDAWNVRLWGSGIRLQQTVALTTSDVWTLQLPELVTVEVTAKHTNGDPFAGALIDADVQPADDVALTPALPAFSAEAWLADNTTDAFGQATVSTLPNSELELPIWNVLDGARFRLPLKTTTKTSVDASSDTVVVAKELPSHPVAVSLRDHAGRVVPGVLRVEGTWGQVYGRDLTDSGSTAFDFPVGNGIVTIASSDQRWFLPSAWHIKQPFNVSADTSLSLTLPEPARVRGTLEDADTDTTVVGGRVEVGGPADAAVLQQGLSPATLFNGSYRPLRATSNVDGGVQYRVFPDQSLTVGATHQGPGVFRVAAGRDVDASGDTSFTVRLPKSVTVRLDLADSHGDEPLGTGAQLRVASEYVVPFARGEDGRWAMRVSRGPALIEVHLGETGIHVDREVDLQEDALLEVRTPATNDLRVLAVGSSGLPVADDRVYVRGNTTVDTESGPMKGYFYAAGSVDNNGFTTVPVPPTTNAEIYASHTRGLADKVKVAADRTLVLVGGIQSEGAGAPYVLFDSAAPFILQRVGDLSFQPIDADTAAVTRTVLTPFGERTTSTTGPIDALDLGTWVGIDYPKGATTCVGSAARRDDVQGPMSLMACRTRPIDDRELTAVNGWTRVDDTSAYGDSYRQASERGSTLRLHGLDVESGPRAGTLSLLAHTGPNAGTVKLFVGQRRISKELSLAGPASDGATLVPIPVRNWLAEANQGGFSGRLRIVVVSDGQRVRIDGLAIPLSPRPYGVLPPTAT